MKYKIILTLFALSIYANCANAETCITTTTSTPAGIIPPASRDYIQYCTSVSYTNYYFSQTSTNAVYSTPQCTACSRGYSLITLSNTGDASWTASCEDNNPTFTICAKACNDSCVSDADYDYDANGVESLIERWCVYNNKICTSDTLYRCSAGYYGTATADGTSGCTRCPVSPAESHYYGQTDPENAKYITDCYIQKSVAYLNDSTGRYSCSDKAYYKN